MIYKAIYIGGALSLISIITLCYVFRTRQSAEIIRLADKKISIQGLNSDFDYLLHVIVSVNPDPYHNASKDRISLLGNEIKSRLNHPITGIEFFRLISPLISAYNDAHLVINNGLYFNEFEQGGGKLFPLRVIIGLNANRLFLNDGAERGKEIVSINGISCISILEKLSHLYPGDSEAYKTTILENGFAICLWKEFGFNGNFKILFKDGSLENIDGQPVVQWLNNKKRKDFFECRSLQNNGQNVAFIKLLSFEGEKKEQFAQFLTQSFKNIHQWGCRSLVIDIRGNIGGSTHLVEQLFNYIAKNPYSISWEEKTFKYGEILTTEDRKLITPTPAENKFKGKVYLLINATTFSSAHMMANAFRFYNMGTVIGDISSEKMLISGEPVFFTLPNSQINGYCPSSVFVLPNTLGPDSRLIPNNVVMQSIDDKLHDKDTQLNFCLKLIAGKN
jgi:hypothetical protein